MCNIPNIPTPANKDSPEHLTSYVSIAQEATFHL